MEELLEKYCANDVPRNIGNDLKALINVLEKAKDKSIEEATNDVIRNYDEALAKCIEAGAKKDDESFMYDFNTQYIHAALSLVSNLLLVNDFAKNKDNIEFVKNKINEVLTYIDKF